MPAVINTAALFYQQFNTTLDLTEYVPLPAMIVGLQADGNRVDVVVDKVVGKPQTPDGDWRESHVPFVADGVIPPATGPFVTDTAYTPVPRATTPTGAAFAAETTGGTLATGTYGYRISALDAYGDETQASAEITASVTGPTGSVVGTWTNSAGTTGIKVYGRTPGGEHLLATLGAVTTWTDTGSATPGSATPPAAS